MEQKIIEELAFLNHNIEKAKQILDRQEKRKRGYIKQLIGNLPFKQFDQVSYKRHDYEITEVSLVERPASTDSLEFEIVYRLLRIHTSWDYTTVFERDVKYMTKL